MLKRVKWLPFFLTISFIPLAHAQIFKELAGVKLGDPYDKVYARLLKDFGQPQQSGTTPYPFAAFRYDDEARVVLIIQSEKPFEHRVSAVTLNGELSTKKTSFPFGLKFGDPYTSLMDIIKKDLTIEAVPGGYTHISIAGSNVSVETLVQKVRSIKIDPYVFKGDEKGPDREPWLK